MRVKLRANTHAKFKDCKPSYQDLRGFVQYAYRRARRLPVTLPPDIRWAFYDALGKLRDWTSGEEPRVVLNFGPCSFDGLCDLVLAYENEHLPDGLFKESYALMDESRQHLKDKVSTGPLSETASRQGTKATINAATMIRITKAIA